MIIYFSKKTRADATDGQNYILQTRHVHDGGKNVGKAYWKNNGYYSNLSHLACSAVVRGIATGSKKLTWEEVARVYDDGIKRLETVCEGAVAAQLAAKLEGTMLSGFDFEDLFDTEEFKDDESAKSDG